MAPERYSCADVFFVVLLAHRIGGRRDQLSFPPAVLKRLRDTVLPFLILNIIFGWLQPGIDNAAHLAGLAAGLVLGWAVARDAAATKPPTRRLLTALALTVVLVIGSVAYLSGRWIPPREKVEARYRDDVADTEQYLRLREEGWHLRAEAYRTNNRRKFVQATEKETAATALFYGLLKRWETMRPRSRSLLSTPALQQRKVVSLFDGRTFQGWEGDTAKTWRIEDGAIVGGLLTTQVPHNEFLTTTRSYDNFVLRLRFKLAGTGFVNAGIQFRSQRARNPSYEMVGYQADIGARYWGSLYDESRRNTVLAGPDQAQAARLVKHDDWNDYEIRCEGRRIRLRLNGEQTVDYTEPDETIPQSGLIGLQIHGGGKAQVSYKDITIEELPLTAFADSRWY